MHCDVPRHWSLRRKGRQTWSCCRCVECSTPRGFTRGVIRRGCLSISRYFLAPRCYDVFYLLTWSDRHSGGQCCRLLHGQGAQQGKEVYNGGWAPCRRRVQEVPEEEVSSHFIETKECWNFDINRYVEIIKDKERNSGRRKFTKKNKTSDTGSDIGAGSKRKKQKTWLRCWTCGITSSFLFYLQNAPTSQWDAVALKALFQHGENTEQPRRRRRKRKPKQGQFF